MSKFVSIVIVNWNGEQLLRECLSSLWKISYRNFEVIVVDNGSHDGSISYLRAQANVKKNLKVIEKKKNLGFAEGNNVGVKEAKGDLILFLNNDTIVEKNFLRILVDAINKDKKIGAIQPKIYNYPETEYLDSIGSYFINSGLLYHFGHNKKDQKKYSRASQVFSLKGACMLFKREVLDAVGVFDAKYFAYFEETDLCMRTWMEGYTIWYEPNAAIYHKGGQTAQRLPSSFVQYHSYKNRIFTYLKNFETATLIKVMPVHLLLCQCIALVYLVTLHFSLALAVEKAIFWNIKNLRRVFIERGRVYAQRKVSDIEYLPLVSKTVRLSYYYQLFSSSLKNYIDKD